jgi:hypothetical protein
MHDSWKLHKEFTVLRRLLPWRRLLQLAGMQNSEHNMQRNFRLLLRALLQQWGLHRMPDFRKMLNHSRLLLWLLLRLKLLLHTLRLIFLFFSIT